MGIASKLIPLGKLKKLLFISSVTVVGFGSEDILKYGE
jgi:hypothetical protein